MSSDITSTATSAAARTCSARSPSFGSGAAIRFSQLHRAQARRGTEVIARPGALARVPGGDPGLPILRNENSREKMAQTACLFLYPAMWLGIVKVCGSDTTIVLTQGHHTRLPPRPHEVGLPRFKSRKDHRQAIRLTANARFSITPGGKLRLPKIGDIPVRWSRQLPSPTPSVTIICDGANRYFASFVIETQTSLLPETEPVTGIDLGLKHFAVLSELRQLRAKSVQDAGWSAFVAMLDYKARLYGRVFHKIGRFQPTSQTCSVCGRKDGPKPLHVREWQCPGCGAWLDRDVNAAVNVARAAGLAVSACGAQVRPGLALAQRGEAGTYPKPRRDAV
jgi:hypothetical protein